MTSLAAVIPTYNHAPFLRATVESVLGQSVTFDEIVVSDNISTDGTASILEEYGHRVRVVRPEHRLSMSAHWNFAFGEVRSDWALLLSSDDLAAPVMSEVLRGAASRHPEAVHIRGAFDTIAADDTLHERRYLMSVRRVTRPPRTLLEQLHGPKVALCAGAVRMRAWRAVGGFPECCELLGDWGLWLRLAPLGPFVYEPRVIAKYRLGHQDELQQGRLVAYVRDQIAIDEQVIPQAAAAAGLLPGDRRLRRASADRFARLVQFVAKETPSDRAVVTELLEPWARRTDGWALLEQLRDGRRVEIGGLRLSHRMRSAAASPLRATHTRWRG